MPSRMALWGRRAPSSHLLAGVSEHASCKVSWAVRRCVRSRSPGTSQFRMVGNRLILAVNARPVVVNQNFDLAGRGLDVHQPGEVASLQRRPSGAVRRNPAGTSP